jgi:hypothetical protein
MNTMHPQPKNQFWFNLLVSVIVAFWGCQAKAATILVTNITVTGTPGLVGGNIGAGDAAATVSSGTISVAGNSTSAGGWIDGNGIPAGITLSFNIQFTTAKPK